MSSIDLSNSEGIAFYWWGSGGLDQNIDFEMWSPTGGWVGRFPDGPAEWRWIFLRWSDLTEVDFDGSRPDPSDIVRIYWTYHTEGVQRVDYIVGWRTQDLRCDLEVRNTTVVELYAFFEAQATVEVYGHGVIRNIGSAELSGQFEVGQGFKDLYARFEVMGITTYAVEGTGDITCPDGVETVLEGMTKTITNMKSGDIVILDFDCTLVETAIEGGTIIFRIKVDDVQIGKSVDRYQYGAGGRWKVPISFMRRYEVPMDGDYIFTVTWYWTDPSPTYPPQIRDGLRTLTIMHII